MHVQIGAVRLHLGDAQRRQVALPELVADLRRQRHRRHAHLPGQPEAGHRVIPHRAVRRRGQRHLHLLLHCLAHEANSVSLTSPTVGATLPNQPRRHNSFAEARRHCRLGPGDLHALREARRRSAAAAGGADLVAGDMRVGQMSSPRGPIRAPLLRRRRPPRSAEVGNGRAAARSDGATRVLPSMRSHTARSLIAKLTSRCGGIQPQKCTLRMQADAASRRTHRTAGDTGDTRGGRLSRGSLNAPVEEGAGEQRSESRAPQPHCQNCRAERPAAATCVTADDRRPAARRQRRLHGGARRDAADRGGGRVGALIGASVSAHLQSLLPETDLDATLEIDASEAIVTPFRKRWRGCV